MYINVQDAALMNCSRFVMLFVESATRTRQACICMLFRITIKVCLLDRLL